MRREGSALVGTLGFALVLIYLVLAAQFRSFRDPLIVLLGSVPLAISGALVFSFLDLTTSNTRPAIGDVVRIVPNHVCVVVNMSDEVVMVRGDEIVGILPVAARGKLR